MKFLWRLKQDFKSNKLSSLLIAPELAFAMICLAVCISLSGSFLSSVFYFSKNYNNNSSIVYFNRGAETPLEDVLSCNSVKSAVFVQYYIGHKDDGMSRFIGNYSASAFEELELPYKGEMVDISKDYGGAIPCMVSQGLAKEYPAGKIFTLNGIDFYPTGSLKDDKLYWMTSYMTGDNFIMCYDKNGILEKKAAEQTIDRSMGNCAFVTAEDKATALVMEQELKELASVRELKSFNWKEKMSDDFDKMSGNLITGVLILILSTAGFLSNILLGIKDNEKDYMCQRYFGQSSAGTVRITAARITVLLIIAAIGSVIFLIRISTGDKSDFGFFELAVSIGITAAVSLLSTTAAGLRLSEKKRVSMPKKK